jgi:hypothetical protein
MNLCLKCGSWLGSGHDENFDHTTHAPTAIVTPSAERSATASSNV